MVLDYVAELVGSRRFNLVVIQVFKQLFVQQDDLVAWDQAGRHVIVVEPFSPTTVRNSTSCSTGVPQVPRSATVRVLIGRPLCRIVLESTSTPASDRHASTNSPNKEQTSQQEGRGRPAEYREAPECRTNGRFIGNDFASPHHRTLYTLLSLTKRTWLPDQLLA